MDDQSEFENRKSKLIKIAAGVLLLVISGLIAWWIVKSKPVAERTRMSTMVPIVEVTELTRISSAVSVDCMGTVIADRDVSLQAEVSGRIVNKLAGLVEGSMVKEGDVLLMIERSDYELALQQSAAALHSAQSALRQEEGRQAVAKHELELISDAATMNEAYKDLALREPQLKAALADVEAKKAALAKAKLDLQRTEIRAPFDAVVQSVTVSAGDYASSGKTLIRLLATDRFFIRASLPLSALPVFPNIGVERFAAELTMADGSTHAGELFKLLPDLSEQGRMARILISVNDPLAGARPMLLGEMVRVTLCGHEVDGVSLLDRSAFRDGSTVWMVDENNRFRILPAEMIQGYERRVLARIEFEDGWRLVTSDVPAPVDGMQIRVHAERPAQ